MTLTCCQDHILTENIWFVWSKTSCSGDKRRCHYAGRQTNSEDRATQPMEAGGWVSQYTVCILDRPSRDPTHSGKYVPNLYCLIKSTSWGSCYKIGNWRHQPHQPLGQTKLIGSDRPDKICLLQLCLIFYGGSNEKKMQNVPSYFQLGRGLGFVWASLSAMDSRFRVLPF